MGKSMDSFGLDLLLKSLLEPINDQSQPQLNQLRLALRDVEAVKLNLKLNGYALARRLAREMSPRAALGPRPVDVSWRPSTQADLQSDWAAHWLSELKIPLVFHRKLWEYAYVLQMLWQHGKLNESARGLGFGCGVEPLPSLFASYGVHTIVTDLAPEAQSDAGWTATNQHTHSLDAAFHSHLVSRDLFDRYVSLRYVDMREIPTDLGDFDFCWSICALEHLGSIQAGLKFIINSLATLKVGGIAVHTTELNFLSEGPTLDNWATVLFKREHFEELACQLAVAGHKIYPLVFDVGQDPLDMFIDIPPYAGDWSAYQKDIWPEAVHMKLSIDGFVSTCFGLVIQKGNSTA